MSYEPSHRKPPRQQRWPNATPGEGWPAYQQGNGGRAWESVAAYPGSRNGYGTASNGHGAAGNGAAGNGYSGTWDGRGTAGNDYGDAWDGHGTARYSDPGSGYRAAGNGYGGTTTAYPTAGDAYAGDGYAGDGYAGDGYAGDAYAGDGYTDGFDGAVDAYAGGYADGYGATEDYQETGNGYGDWDGFAQPGHEFTGSPGYLPQEEYPALEPAGSSVLVAPDTMGEWWRQADGGDGASRDLADRGPVVGAVTGLLAAAVAIGVATFAAALVRLQASPVSAVSAVLIDRIPATLRSHLTAHFGTHGQVVLLLGVIGLVAMVFGCAARRNASLGVAGIAALCLLGAFVAITRPESRAGDVVPWAVGGLAGILALLWLVRASAPTPEVASFRPARSGGGRRAG